MITATGKSAAEGKNIKYLCFSRVLFKKKNSTGVRNVEISLALNVNISALKDLTQCNGSFHPKISAEELLGRSSHVMVLRWPV